MERLNAKNNEEKRESSELVSKSRKVRTVLTKIELHLPVSSTKTVIASVHFEIVHLRLGYPPASPSHDGGSQGFL